MIIDLSFLAKVFSHINIACFICETDLSDSFDLSHCPLSTVLRLVILGQYCKFEVLGLNSLQTFLFVFVTAKHRQASKN